MFFSSNISDIFMEVGARIRRVYSIRNMWTRYCVYIQGFFGYAEEVFCVCM